MQGNGRKFHLCKGHILHNQGIHARFICLKGGPLCRSQFRIEQQGVEGQIDTRAERVSFLCQRGNILHGVARCGSGSEALGTDIDGIRSGMKRCTADSEITGWRKQFNGVYSPEGVFHGRKGNAFRVLLFLGG